MHVLWYYVLCFNPRPRREGDVVFDNCPDMMAWFQSAPSQGGRQIMVRGYPGEYSVSIRALAGRATLGLGHGQRIPMFQSAPSQGGRREEGPTPSVNSSFNPRPRREGDVVRSDTSTSGALFQSAPSQGGRLAWSCEPPPTGPCFNPRPRREGDPARQCFSHYLRVSIRALAGRATFLFASN